MKKIFIFLSVMLSSCSNAGVEVDTSLFLDMVKACNDGLEREQCLIWNKAELTELNQRNWESAISTVLESDLSGTFTGRDCWKGEACMKFDITLVSPNSFQDEIMIDLQRKQGRWYLSGVTFSADPEKVEDALARICSQDNLTEDEQKKCSLIRQ